MDRNRTIVFCCAGPCGLREQTKWRESNLVRLFLLSIHTSYRSRAEYSPAVLQALSNLVIMLPLRYYTTQSFATSQTCDSASEPHIPHQ